MNDLTRSTKVRSPKVSLDTRKDSGSFVDRLRQQFNASGHPAGSLSSASCILLDTSGSMWEFIGANSRKIDSLRLLAGNFKDVRRFEFGSTCRELAPKDEIGDPKGGTSMHVAFLTLKAKGITHCVMITDGLPDSMSQALSAAQGLKIDVFYVGPDPAPPWLALLARETGGQYGAASLDARPALESRVRGLLPAPTKEPIKL